MGFTVAESGLDYFNFTFERLESILYANYVVRKYVYILKYKHNIVAYYKYLYFILVNL